MDDNKRNNSDEEEDKNDDKLPTWRQYIRHEECTSSEEDESEVFTEESEDEGYVKGIKNTFWSDFYEWDTNDFSKKFHQSLKIDGTKEMYTVETTEQHTAMEQENVSEYKDFKTEEPEKVALLEREEERETNKDVFMYENGNYTRLWEVKVDEEHPNRLYRWEKCTNLNAIEETTTAKAVDEQEKNHEEISDECAQIAENLKNEHASDSEFESDNTMAAKGGNVCAAEGETSIKKSILKRKGEMPVNVLQEPKVKKKKFHIPEETKEKNSSETMHLKRKRVQMNPNRFSKKSKLDGEKAGEKITFHDDNIEEEPKNDENKTEEEPKNDENKTEEEPQDNESKKNEKPKNPSCGV